MPTKPPQDPRTQTNTYRIVNVSPYDDGSMRLECNSCQTVFMVDPSIEENLVLYNNALTPECPNPKCTNPF